MSTALLSLATRIQLAGSDALRRARDEERGQTFVEWLAVMAVIVALVGLLTGALGPVSDAVISVAERAINAVGDRIS